MIIVLNTGSWHAGVIHVFKPIHPMTQSHRMNNHGTLYKSTPTGVGIKKTDRYDCF
jgi:hypothetical protein